MAACNFTIILTSPASEVFQNMKSKIEKQGGTLNGDDTAGAFSVSVFGSVISGSYSISGTQMDVVIDHKPFLISCNQIKSFLESNI
jgi:hypothetical protein